MVSFVQQTIFFLAGVSLVVSVPTGNSSTNAGQIPAIQKEVQIPLIPEADRDSTNKPQVNLGKQNAVNVLDAVSSIAELTDDQRRELQKPLTKLIENFDGTLFGSLFAYILKTLQNPRNLEAQKTNDMELLEKTPLALKSLILTLQQLDDKVIRDSKAQFDEIFEILGDARFATMFREIFNLLQVRQVLFQYADMGEEMLKNLPSMLADASKTGSENVQQLIQKSGPVAALMPNLAEMKSPNSEGVQIQTTGSEKNLMPHPVEALNAAKNMVSRLRIGSIPSLQRMGSAQRRMQLIPPFKPEILKGPRGTMPV